MKTNGKNILVIYEKEPPLYNQIQVGDATFILTLIILKHPWWQGDNCCNNILIWGVTIFSYTYCWCEEQTLVSFSSSWPLSSLSEFLGVATGLGTAPFHFLSKLNQITFTQDTVKVA